MNCVQRREKCIFNRDGKCDILTDTVFNRPSSNMRCPFYKERPIDVIVDRYFNGILFRSVKGYGGKYYVSAQGNIVNSVGKPLKRGLVNGHPYVQLKDDLTMMHKRRSVAVLVADAFIPGTGVVGHKDGDFTNCDMWNLYRIGESDGNEK